MAYDMVLKWRRGTENVSPDGLSRLQRRSSQELDGEAVVPGDSGEEMPQKEPAGAVLDGVPLQKLAHWSHYNRWTRSSPSLEH